MRVDVTHKGETLFFFLISGHFYLQLKITLDYKSFTSMVGFMDDKGPLPPFPE